MVIPWAPLQALLDVALADPVLGPRRIALFSLGTMCVYSSCRPVRPSFPAAPRGNGCQARLVSLEFDLAFFCAQHMDSLHPPLEAALCEIAASEAGQDPQVAEHAARVRKKLALPGSG